MKKTLLFILLLLLVPAALFIKKCFFDNKERKEIYSIEPQSKWDTIILGKWNFEQKERNDSGWWYIFGHIDFSNDNKFKMSMTAEYFDLTAYDTSKAKTRSGGSLEGKWKILPAGFRLDNISNCDVKPTKRDIGTYTRNEFHKFPGCVYFEEKNYSSSDNDLSLQLKSFNNKTILITGMRYSDASDIQYKLYR